MGRSRPYDQLLAVCLLSCRVPRALSCSCHCFVSCSYGVLVWCGGRVVRGGWGLLWAAAALQERKALKASQQQAMLTAQAGAAGGAPPMHLRPTKSKNEKDECVIAPTPPLPPAALHLSLCQAACFQACLVGTAPRTAPAFTPARLLLCPPLPLLAVCRQMAGMPIEPIRQPPLTFCGRASREVLMWCGGAGAPISPGKMSTPGGAGGAKKRKSDGGCQDCPLSCFVGVWDQYGEGVPGRLALLQDLPLR
jgi:hypothetical protein